MRPVAVVLAAFSVAACMSLPLCALAAEPSGDAALAAAYNAGNYAECERAARAALGKSPQEPHALYYLGLSLVKLNKLEEAMPVFAACMQFTKDKSLQDYCRREMEALRANVGGELARGPTGDVEASATPAPAGTEVLPDAQRILQQAMKEIEWKRKRADEQINRINHAVVDQMQSVPTVIYTAYPPYQIPNPDYPTTFARVRGKADKEIGEINERFEKDKKAIEDDCDKRVAALREAAGNTVSQCKPGTSGVQATPKGSSAFVRNIVNYSDAQFYAKPQSAKAGVWQAGKQPGHETK